MLANQEPITGIKVADVFAMMLAELPWPSLRNYVQANSQIAKLCLIGGYRLEPKHRKRFEIVVLKEAEKAEFSQLFCNPLFAQWYPVHQEIYKSLEDYLHSDDYKTYRQGLNLDEDVYVLPDTIFDSVFKAEALEAWRILLCFSPLQFSKEQAVKILANEGANEVILKRSRGLEEMLDDARRENARLSAEQERLKAQVDGTAAELQELRRLKRDLSAEKADLLNKFDASQSENRRLRQQLQQKEQELLLQVTQAATSWQQEKSRLSDTIQKIERELIDWRGRYEAQRAEDRELKKTLQDTESLLTQERATVKARDARIQELSVFADALLARIDWPRIGRELHLTPSLQRQFNSVMKKLHYEENMSLSLPDTLPVFWQKLATQEAQLVIQVAQSNTLEVMSGTSNEFWHGLKDPFDDVIIGLEARLILLKLLQEIFFELFETDDLEVDQLPKKATAAKRS